MEVYETSHCRCDSDALIAGVFTTMTARRRHHHPQPPLSDVRMRHVTPRKDEHQRCAAAVLIGQRTGVSVHARRDNYQLSLIDPRDEIVL